MDELAKDVEQLKREFRVMEYRLAELKLMVQALWGRHSFNEKTEKWESADD